jgi:hypothetical protein
MALYVPKWKGWRPTTGVVGEPLRTSEPPKPPKGAGQQAFGGFGSSGLGDRLAEIPSWPVDRINSESAVLVVTASVLGREILFVPDDWTRPEGEERPAFNVAELRKLTAIRPRPAELRTLVELCMVFGGTIEGVQGWPTEAEASLVAIMDSSTMTDGAEVLESSRNLGVLQLRCMEAKAKNWDNDDGHQS